MSRKHNQKNEVKILVLTPSWKLCFLTDLKMAGSFLGSWFVAESFAHASVTDTEVSASFMS